MGMHSAPRKFRPARTAAEARFRLKRSLAPQLTGTQVVITVLFLILGFTLTAAVSANKSEAVLSSARQSDLVGLLDDLAQREARLEAENDRLENARETLLGGNEYFALNEAKRRAAALGVLAGSEEITAPGIEISIRGSLSSSVLLDAIQELRDSGAIAIQISNKDKAVRVVTNSWFGDTTNGVAVSGVAIQVPILISVIGDPAVLIPAIKIPGGLVDNVGAGGGKVAFKESENVEISATVPLPNL